MRCGERRQKYQELGLAELSARSRKRHPPQLCARPRRRLWNVTFEFCPLALHSVLSGVGLAWTPLFSVRTLRIAYWRILFFLVFSGS